MTYVKLACFSSAKSFNTSQTIIILKMRQLERQKSRLNTTVREIPRRFASEHFSRCSNG